MKEILITSRQRMLAPDQLAHELNILQTPENMDNNINTNSILIGALATLAIVTIVYVIHQNQNNYRNSIKTINDSDKF
jgi:hypothetical protein